MATARSTRRFVFWASFLCIVCGASGVSRPLPSIIKPCSINDPNLNECAAANAVTIVPKLKNGIPAYGVPTMDPLLVKVTDIDEKKLGMHLKLINMNIIGLSKSKVQSIKMDTNPPHFRWKLLAPTLVMKGKYEASGRVLILPITGKGDINITLDNVDYTYEFMSDLVKKSDGEVYMVPKTSSIEYEVQRVQISMENLFNGNKRLGDEMNRFMNENWREMTDAIGPQLVESIATALQVITRALTSRVPFNKFFPEKV